MFTEAAIRELDQDERERGGARGGRRFNSSVGNQNREHRRESRRHGRQANYSDASAPKGPDLPYITLVISARAMRALSRLIGGRDRYARPQAELFGKEVAFFGSRLLSFERVAEKGRQPFHFLRERGLI